jgi:hypothetical protein
MATKSNLELLFGGNVAGLSAQLNTQASPLRKAKRGNDTIHAGPFRLHNYAKGKFWLSNEDGEGMETSEVKITELLKGFFEREF